MPPLLPQPPGAALAEVGKLRRRSFAIVLTSPANTPRSSEGERVPERCHTSLEALVRAHLGERHVGCKQKHPLLDETEAAKPASSKSLPTP